VGQHLRTFPLRISLKITVRVPQELIPLLNRIHQMEFFSEIDQIRRSDFLHSVDILRFMRHWAEQVEIRVQIGGDLFSGKSETGKSDRFVRDQSLCL
jgi:hypothetical protein